MHHTTQVLLKQCYKQSD